MRNPIEKMENGVKPINGTLKNSEKKNPFQYLTQERDYNDSLIKNKVELFIKVLDSRLINLDDYNWANLTSQEQRNVIRSLISEVCPSLTPNLVNIVAGSFYYGDSGNSPHVKPDWLDMEKFKRGQKVGREHFFGISFSQMLSLFTLLSFDHGLRVLIFTDKSSTPYTSFRRYLSTSIRCKNWYTEDPWDERTQAYKDIILTRKMHARARMQLHKISPEEVKKSTELKNVICPGIEFLDDINKTCPEPAINQCPYVKMQDIPEMNVKGLSQAEMCSATLGFCGLFITFPKLFGAHNISEEDLDAFHHTWKGLLYLLGIDDEFSFCRGTLNDVKQTSKDILHIWIKPNLRQVTKEWEYMMRCVVEGVNYIFPGLTYEVSLLFLSELMDLPMSGLRKSLSYFEQIRYKFFQYIFRYLLQIPGMNKLCSELLIMRLKSVFKITPEYEARLQKKSEETLKKLVKML